MTILAARGIRKSYGGREVVAGIDLELVRGECFGLIGPNGAGKTTTLRMLLGLTHPDAGEITLLGHPVPKAAREGRIRVGVVPLQAVLDWARPQHLPIVVVPGGEHFFHRKLHILREIVSRWVR